MAISVRAGARTPDYYIQRTMTQKQVVGRPKPKKKFSFFKTSKLKSKLSPEARKLQRQMKWVRFKQAGKIVVVPVLFIAGDAVREHVVLPEPANTIMNYGITAGQVSGTVALSWGALKDELSLQKQREKLINSLAEQRRYLEGQLRDQRRSILCVQRAQTNMRQFIENLDETREKLFIELEKKSRMKHGVKVREISRKIKKKAETPKEIFNKIHEANPRYAQQVAATANALSKSLSPSTPEALEIKNSLKEIANFSTPSSKVKVSVDLPCVMFSEQMAKKLEGLPPAEKTSKIIGLLTAYTGAFNQTTAVMKKPMY